jgi:site-specific DNA-adenine methylase
MPNVRANPYSQEDIMIEQLRVPCAYQGGKQRVAAQIVDKLLKTASDANAKFYDLCCGSGAVSIELINRGVDASRIYMLDISSWGKFWKAVGSGTFDMAVFQKFLSNLPSDKRKMKLYMSELAALPVHNEAELYPILQACSFGGKQIWRNGNHWANTCFRDYWEPTATSVRRSPANPMQPSPSELNRRVEAIVDRMRGVVCQQADITTVLNSPISRNSVVYVDPPYKASTGYAFKFDLSQFIERFKKLNQNALFVSEGAPLNEDALRLSFGGAKGGISGTKKGRHQEWLNVLN